MADDVKITQTLGDDPVMPRSAMFIRLHDYAKSELSRGKEDYQELVDFCLEMIALYDKHSVTDDDIRKINRKTIGLCMDALGLYAKYDIGEYIDWARYDRTEKVMP